MSERYVYSDSARSHLMRCYAINNGQIDPWGTIRVVANGVVDDGVMSNAPLPIRTGLTVYGEKLIQYGNGKFRVRISADSSTVRLFNKDEALVDEISFDDFLAVDTSEALVHDDGHLEKFCSKPGRDWQSWKKALRQAAVGKKPSLLDNSPFIQVDNKFVDQIVIALTWGPDEQYAVVYTKDGERIPCKVHYPLSYAKWEPTSEYAQYSVSESTAH